MLSAVICATARSTRGGLQPGERIEQRLCLRALERVAQLADFLGAQIEPLDHGLGEHLHALALGEQLRDDRVHALEADIGLQAVLGLLEGALELSGLVARLRRDLERLFEQCAQPVLQVLEHLHVARDDVARVQVVCLVVGEGLLAVRVRRQYLAELGIHARDVLVPEREAHRVEPRLLLRHERQGKSQELGASLAGFLVAHRISSACRQSRPAPWAQAGWRSVRGRLANS